MTQTKDEATLKIAACQQEDVAEYKIEASNPAGKASSVANLVLTRKSRTTQLCLPIYLFIDFVPGRLLK